MNSLNRDMNQQNKTERWEELKKDFNRVVNKYFGEVSCRCGSKESVILEPKEFTEDMWSFILQLLSDARRELLDEILDDFGNYDDGCGCCARHTLQEKLTEKYKEDLTTAEENIKKLK